MSAAELAGHGGWLLVAATLVVAFGKFVVLFGRFVAAVVTLAAAAKAWFEREAQVQTSTLEHHERVKAHLEQVEDEEQTVMLLVDRAVQA